MERKIGFIGLGIMGLPAAKNLIRSGFRVVGFSLDNLERFVEAGGIVANSAAEVAEACEVVIHCLSVAKALDDVVYGERGILKTLRPGTVVIELSTYALDDKQRLADALAAKSCHLLDCEMTSRAGPATVTTREFIIMVSGERQIADRVQTVFDGMTDNSKYVGPFGSSLKLKTVNNLVVAVNLMAAVEAISLGVKAGLAAGDVVDLLRRGAGGSAALEKYGDRIATESFDKNIGGTVGVFYKYFGLIENLAASCDAVTPLADSTHEYFKRALEAGYEKRDVSSIFSIINKEGRTR